MSVWSASPSFDAQLLELTRFFGSLCRTCLHTTTTSTTGFTLNKRYASLFSRLEVYFNVTDLLLVPLLARGAHRLSLPERLSKRQRHTGVSDARS